LSNLIFLLLLTVAALAIHGYHLGVEDQAIYLPAIKKNLDPALYPYDSAFFLAQTKFTLFDELMAFSVKVTRLPLDVVLFSWHVLSIFLLLLACWRFSQRCFVEPEAQCGAVATLAALLTLPIAGTLLLVWDQYLHPRALATVALLFALVATLDRRLMAAAWLALAAVMHPQMAFYGGIHLAVLASGPGMQRGLAALFPALGWEPSNPAWRELLKTRKDWLVFQWTWYEWLGALAPLVLLRGIARIAQRSAAAALEHVSRRVAVSGGLMVAGAIVVNAVPGLERFIPLQPMRGLHLVYIVFVLLAGGLIGRHFLQRRPLRWVLFFLPLCAVMFHANRLQFPSSPQIEWPGATLRNPWTLAFDWIRRNTPRDALFALDPAFMERPGEDFRGFRALAERSMVADYVKDRGVVALSPGLAYSWRQEVEDRKDWARFRGADFRRLKQRYGVSWVVVERPGVPELSCPFLAGPVMVCRID